MGLLNTLPGSGSSQVSPVKPSAQIQIKESFFVAVTHVPPFLHTFTLQGSPVEEEISFIKTRKAKIHKRNAIQGKQ